MTSKQKWAFIGILLIAIFFRFYQIKAMPGGLFPDEAANGIDVIAMQRGNIQPFYEGNNGRESLFFFMLWGSVEVFGKGPWQHHIVSAFVGLISVLACFLVTRELFSIFYDGTSDQDKERIEKQSIYFALLSSFFMAASAWHTVLSRTAFRANLIPLFAAFTFYFLILAFKARARNKQYLYSALTGIAFALGFYSYIAYRIMIPLVAIAIVWPILVDIFSSPRFNRTKKFITPAVICSAVFAIFIAPLAYYFYMHPRSFVGRSGQVSIFNPDLNHGDLFGTFVKVFLKSVGAYFWNGDLNWRHNISGKPFLSIIISPFFGVGLIMATTLAARYAIKPLKYKTDWKYFVLAGWFWAMMLPTVTTAESIPHGLRSIGTIPSVFILSAVGLMAIFNFVSKVYNLYWEQIKGRERKLITNARNILAIVFVVSLISQAYIHCFVVAANDTKYFYAFRSDLTTVSEYLKEHGNKTNTYLILDKFSAMTVDYMTTADSRNPENPKNNPYKQLNPEDSWKLTNLKFGDQLVFAQSSLFDIEKFKQCHPEAQLIREDRNKFNQIVMTVYVIGK